MSCPCGLSKEEVLDLDKRGRIILDRRGRCQNSLANGDEGICGRALGAHPQQGKVCCT